MTQPQTINYFSIILTNIFFWGLLPLAIFIISLMLLPNLTKKIQDKKTLILTVLLIFISEYIFIELNKFVFNANDLTNLGLGRILDTTALLLFGKNQEFITIYSNYWAPYSISQLIALAVYILVPLRLISKKNKNIKVTKEVELKTTKKPAVKSTTKTTTKTKAKAK